MTLRKILTRRGTVWVSHGRIFLELNNNGAPLFSLSEGEARELLHALTDALVPREEPGTHEEPDEWIPPYARSPE